MACAAKTKRWRASEVDALLAKKWPKPAYVILREVRNGTGFVEHERYADMLVFSVWPSRGISVTGVEIKVSRADWRKEACDPTKADAIGKYCDYWFVAAPKGVVPVEEVPDTWGLIECSGNRISATKAAPRRETVPPDWLFVASVMRGLDKSLIPIAQHQIEVRRSQEQSAYDAKELVELRSQKRSFERLAKSVADFERASGVSISEWNGGVIGDAVNVVVEGGLAGVKRSLHSIVAKMDKTRELCVRMCEQLDGTDV